MNAECLPWVEVVLSGEVTLESLRPTLTCVRQLVSDTGTYVIRAEDVTRIERAAAALLLGFVDDATEHGSVIRWVAASRCMIDTIHDLTFGPRLHALAG